MAKYSADKVAPHLSRRVSIVGLVLAVSSLFLSCMPPVGLILGGTGLLVMDRNSGWPQWVCMISMVISAVIFAIGGLVFC